MKVACLYFPQDIRLYALAEACLNWSPQVALGRQSIFIEIGKCENLFTEQDFTAQILELCETFEASPQIAMGQDLPTALAMARFQIFQKELLPVEALEDFINPFHFDESCQAMILSLQRLGVASLGSLLRLPPKTIPSRFGKLGLSAIQRVHYSDRMPWPQFHPRKEVSERHEFDFTDRVTQLQPLLFALKRLTQYVMSALRGRGEQVSQLQLILMLEKKQTESVFDRTLTVDFPLPQSHVDAVLDILKEKLEGHLLRSPLEQPVEVIELRATELVPGSNAQKDFFRKKEEEKEAWNSLIARLNERLGPESAYFAEIQKTPRPEKGWKKTLEEPKPLQLPFSPRPLRLLTTPEKIRRLDNRLIHPRQSWKIALIRGPEHLSGEWWFHEFRRLYYCIETTSGEELWVFKAPPGEDLFLHGFFD